jgi:phosphohistidine phosphatase SixA
MENVYPHVDPHEILHIYHHAGEALAELIICGHIPTIASIGRPIYEACHEE